MSYLKFFFRGLVVLGKCIGAMLSVLAMLIGITTGWPSFVKVADDNGYGPALDQTTSILSNWWEFWWRNLKEHWLLLCFFFAGGVVMHHILVEEPTNASKKAFNDARKKPRRKSKRTGRK